MDEKSTMRLKAYWVSVATSATLQMTSTLWRDLHFVEGGLLCGTVEDLDRPVVIVPFSLELEEADSLVATDYNALLSAKDCLIHLKEHAGQSLSMWKNSLFGSATDYPLMARDCFPHIEALQVKLKSRRRATSRDFMRPHAQGES